MSQQAQDDPLSDLYVDKDDFNRKRLAEALRPFLGIDAETEDLVTRSAWTGLDGKEKVTAYLLYRRALEALNEIDSTETGQGAKEIAEKTGVKYNTVRSYLTTLPFVKNEDKRGGHHVPSYSIDEAISFLTGD